MGIALWVVSKFKGWIVAGLGALAFFAYFYKQVRDDAKREVTERIREEQDNAIEEKRELENDVADDSDSDLDERLSRWVKD
jgi:hypothetical protein